MKLIKLSDTHYVVVDDSEIKIGNDWCYGKDINNNMQITIHEVGSNDIFHKNLKITHSTQPLGIGWQQEVIELQLSEVEELVNSYSVEKMAEKRWGKDLSTKGHRIGFEDGFKTHQELVKDKLFTMEDIKKAIEMAWEADSIDGVVDLNVVLQFGYNDDLRTKWSEKEIIQSLLPLTSWDVTFDEQGKLKLI